MAGTTHYVYALLDALGVEVYIGKTNNPRTRLGVHHNSPCGRPMRDAVLHGCRFRMRILSSHSSEFEAFKEESRQIALRKPDSLLNVAQNYRPGVPRGHQMDPTQRWWFQRQQEAGTVIDWR
jgi:predicted GIY-YIG superfamily endonuclease